MSLHLKLTFCATIHNVVKIPKMTPHFELTKCGVVLLIFSLVNHGRQTLSFVHRPFSFRSRQ